MSWWVMAILVLGAWACVAWALGRVSALVEAVSKETKLKEFWEKRAIAGCEASTYLLGLSDVMFTNDEIQYAMGQIGDDDSTYRAIVKTLQKQFEVEESAALAPGADGVREYNAGRAAAVSDAVAMLEQMRAAGRRRSEEERGNRK